MELRFFLGELVCPGEVYDCGDTEEPARCMPGICRGEGRFASCQLRFDILEGIRLKEERRNLGTLWLEPEC